MGRNKFQLPGTRYGVDGVERSPIQFEDGDFYYVAPFYQAADLEDLIDAIEEREGVDDGIADMWASTDGYRLKRRESEELAKQVEEYQSKGGTITYLEEGERSGVFDGGD